MFGKLVEDGVFESPNDQTVEVARQHLGAVCDAFASADLSLLRVEHDGMTAELVDADLKGNPCARATFVKE